MYSNRRSRIKSKLMREKEQIKEINLKNSSLSLLHNSDSAKAYYILKLIQGFVFHFGILTNGAENFLFILIVAGDHMYATKRPSLRYDVPS